jgi:hypothetical protein
VEREASLVPLIAFLLVTSIHNFPLHFSVSGELPRSTGEKTSKHVCPTIPGVHGSLHPTAIQAA